MKRLNKDYPSATILEGLDSMLGRSLAPAQLPFVNSVYGLLFPTIFVI